MGKCRCSLKLYMEEQKSFFFENSPFSLVQRSVLIKFSHVKLSLSVCYPGKTNILQQQNRESCPKHYKRKRLVFIKLVIL